MKTPIFDSYDDGGYRTTVTGGRASKVEDEALVSNLRFKYKEELDGYSDQQIVNTYDLFAITEDFGDDDIWLTLWLLPSANE